MIFWPWRRLHHARERTKMDGDDINGAYKISLDVCMSYYIVMNEVKRFIKEWAKGWG